LTIERVLKLVSSSIPCYLDDGSVDRAPIALPLVYFAKKCVGLVSDDKTITLDAKSWL
jgi:hypothetical protein